VIKGGAGDDVIDTSAAGAIIDMSQGGDDTVTVNPNFTANISFGAAFTADDQVIAQATSFTGGAPRVVLDGDYSAGVVMNATTLQNIQSLFLTGGHDYDLTLDADLTYRAPSAGANGSRLLVQDSLGASDSLTLDATALTSPLALLTGAGTFDITLGSYGGHVQIAGSGAGSVTDATGVLDVNTDANFSSAISLTSEGGTLNLLGTGFTHDIIFTASMMEGFNELVLATGASVTLADGNIAAGHGLLVMGTEVTVDDSAETDGFMIAEINGGTITGGAGNDSLEGDKHSDVFTGGGGKDGISCGQDTDRLIYNAVSDSTSTGYDDVANFDVTRDIFQLPSAPTGIDAAVTTGTLSTASFDTDLAAAVGAGQLAAHHAVVFTPDAGQFSGVHFLVIDANGTAGYQAGQDYVIEMDNSANLSSLSLANFS
jgi:hypothetical protein